jgi:hypothetical protein
MQRADIDECAPAPITRGVDDGVRSIISIYHPEALGIEDCESLRIEIPAGRAE